MFTKRLSPSQLRTSSRLLMICGLLLVTALVSWVLPSPHLAQAAPALPTATAGTWTVTGSLQTARASHTATVLPDGRVLVAGGAIANGSLLNGAELYDPATGTWTPTGSLQTTRVNQTATLLADGRVLVAGGYGPNDTTVVLSSAELYNPPAGPTPTPVCVCGRPPTPPAD